MNVSPTFGNSIAIKIPECEKISQTPIRNSQANKEEKKGSPEQKLGAIARTCESAKPSEKDLILDDPTRANTTESTVSNRGARVMSGKLTEKLQLLKSGKKQTFLAQSSEEIKQTNSSYSKNQIDVLTEDSLLKGKKIFPKQSSALKAAGRLAYDPTMQNNCQSFHPTQKRSNCFSEERKAQINNSIKKTPLNVLNTLSKTPEEASLYLEEDQISPLENPSEEWEKCLLDIKCTTNWTQQFNACNIIRRLCAHHPNILVSSSIQFHALILDLLKISDSLRTSLAKNGLLAFKGIFILHINY